MTLKNSKNVVTNESQEREIRLRFMRIDARTGELLRELWKIVEPALPEILEGFYKHVIGESQLARMIGNNAPRLKRHKDRIGRAFSTAVSIMTICRAFAPLASSITRSGWNRGGTSAVTILF